MISIIFACLCLGYHGRCQTVPSQSYVVFTLDNADYATLIERNQCQMVKH